MMKKSALILSALALFGSSMTFANTNTTQKQAPQKNPAVEQALKECHGNTGVKKQGERPSESEMKKVAECMEKKGFKKPEGQRPQMNPEMKKAFEECRGNTAKKQGERPSESEMKKVSECMAKKGFKKPEGQPAKAN